MSFWEIQPGRVVLHLTGSCVQTVARRARQQLMQALLEETRAEATSPDTTMALQLLTDFLQGADFSALRAANPALAGAEPCTVLVQRGPGGQAVCRVVGGKSDGRGD